MFPWESSFYFIRLFLRRSFCEIFHPVVPAYFEECHDTFENLIGFEAEEHRPRRASAEGGYDRRRKYHTKYGNRIVFEHEAHVAAGFHKSEETTALVARAHGSEA